jgi:hypothetical protein
MLPIDPETGERRHVRSQRAHVISAIQLLLEQAASSLGVSCRCML